MSRGEAGPALGHSGEGPEGKRLEAGVSPDWQVCAEFSLPNHLWVSLILVAAILYCTGGEHQARGPNLDPHLVLSAWHFVSTRRQRRALA